MMMMQSLCRAGVSGFFLPAKKKMKCNQIDAAESSRVESETGTAALQWIAPYF